MSQRIRVASVSFSVEGIRSFDDFAARVTRHVRYAKEWGAEVVLFPEFTTLPLLEISPSWNDWTQKYSSLFQELAQKNQLTIVGGTHVAEQGNSRKNNAHVFLTDGSHAIQSKSHITPWEKRDGVTAGSEAVIFKVGSITCGIAICYDVEFPGLVEHLVRHGVQVLLVPSCTDDLQGYYRVRYCCQARTIEHQIYVVQAPLVGHSAVKGFEQNIGAAGIYTPCDIGLPQNGVLAEGGWNQDACIIGDLDIDYLSVLQKNGAVTPRLDQRDCSKISVKNL